MEKIPQAQNEAPKVDKDLIKQRIKEENIPNLSKAVIQYQSLISEFSSTEEPKLRYEIAKKFRQVAVVDSDLVSRLSRIDEYQQMKEYSAIGVIDVIRILDSLIKFFDATMAESSIEDKNNLSYELENAIDHYLRNSFGSFNAHLSPDDTSVAHLIQRANLLQAQGREATHQYEQAALFYKRTNSDEFKDKIVEMKEKSQTETYTEPSDEERWERAKQLYELVKSFLEEIQGESILQIDPVTNVQKIVEDYKS